METVSFIAMGEGTKADYDLLARYEEEYIAGLPDRLLVALDRLRHSTAGYKVTRYEHSLQSATRAHRDGRDEEYVVAALLHDIGDELAPYTHGEMVAAVLRPYVRPRCAGWSSITACFRCTTTASTRATTPMAASCTGITVFDACAEFCELYDQNCFDPEYDSLGVEAFEPMLRRVLAQPRYL